ncbi:aromatic amino acid ammonia-lyase [Cloacibacillus sp. An23]|uniref:HAL/PAL/TAL family ammonia-lyase n=1 Tax=Cloacibacillus sp. An23 TaxID=1965591 RepID=UPI00194FD1DA|nr:aromatic amino acid ammonia-lyase [Cloacibacillus sp. An23]
MAKLDIVKLSKCITIQNVCIGPGPLPLEEFIAVVRYGAKVKFSDEYRQRVVRSRILVEKILDENRVVYGLTTGFGDNVRTIIPQEEAIELQYNILRSHAVSVGEPLPEDEVRAIWLMQLLSLGRGYSGIRMEMLDLIAQCLNSGIYPFVPRFGSVQALVLEANVNLVLIGEGQAWYKGELLTGAEALQKAGLSPLAPACKEGLCLTNGANSATGLAALALYDSLIAVQTADVSAAMSYEALKGNILACDPRLHSVKEHPNQITCAENIRILLHDSSIMENNKGQSVQDPLALRSVPQMHGAVKRYLADAGTDILEEMASCSDNPVLWPDGDDGVALMGANFDSTFSSGAADIISIADSNLAKLLERRIDKLTNRNFSGYPAFLAAKPGVDNGYMILQYTAAGLVNEIRGLALPATADSIPTCANWEDPVSMGLLASQKALDIAQKLQYIVAIELMVTSRAFDLFTEGVGCFASATQAVRDKIRTIVPPMTGDRHLSPEVEKVKKIVSEGEIIRVAETYVGNLGY